MVFFVYVVLFLGIGGYIFTNKIINDKNKTSEPKVVKKAEDNKIDKNKDFIYYENASVISEGAEIDYRDVVINLKNQTVLTDTLKKENERYKESIQHISDKELISEEIINYNNDDIYAMNFRIYENYEYGNYLSLVVKDYNYTCFDGSTFSEVKSYIFDALNDKLLSEDDILSKYNLNMDEIKEQVKEKLTSDQKIVDEKELIKIDDTISNLDEHALYINEYGRLFISFLVKTTQVDYNESMEVK